MMPPRKKTRLLGVRVQRCLKTRSPRRNPVFAPLREFGVFLSPELSERGDGWPVQGCTIHCEMRTMARTIPADFQRVPVDVAPEVSASGGMQMKGTALVPIRRDLFQAVSDDCATSRF